MRRGRLFLLPLLSIIIALGVDYKVSASNQSTFNNGIYLENTDLSQMTLDEATAMIEKQVEEARKSELTLISPTGNSVVVTAEELHLSWANQSELKTAFEYGKKGNPVQKYKAAKDLERENINLQVTYEIDDEYLRAVIEGSQEEFNQEAVDYSFEMTEDGLQVVAGKDGVVVDVDQSVESIRDFLANDWNGQSGDIALVSTVDKPQGDAQTLGKVKDIIGSYTTDYKTSGASRCQNVENGCQFINGTTLYPGEEFSVLEALVPFTEANGYMSAASYQNGLVVDTLGGGICQVSSTLYNAVLLAELEVTERQNHSMVVTYVPSSGDAAIAESSGKDFKFKNNRDYPIYIEGITADKKITFNIYGIEDRPDNREISFTSEVLEETEPETESIVQDGSKPMGYTSLTPAHKGVKARYIKTVKVDGVVQSTEVVNNSTYRMVPRTLVVGTAGDNPEYAAMLQAAIATGSIDETRAAANAIGAAVAAQQLNVVAGDP